MGPGTPLRCARDDVALAADKPRFLEAVILDKSRYAAQTGIHLGAGQRPMMDPGRPPAAQDDGCGSGDNHEASTPKAPTGLRPRGFAPIPRKGMRGAGWRADQSRASVSGVGVGMSMQRRSRAAGLRARVFWASRLFVLAYGTKRPVDLRKPRLQRQSLAKPATPPGRTMPRDSPLGRVQRGEDRAGVEARG